jgi:two-component system, OmpR family, phosphate regulon sensor histidine kinase PhoR
MSSDSAALADLVACEREALLANWRRQVRALPSARELDVPTLNDHVPQLIDELIEALRSPPAETLEETIDRDTPAAHGAQRVEDGYDIEEVVAEYNLLRGCVHDLGDAHGLSLQGQPFHILNGVFDRAIGVAVKTFAVHSALEVQQRRDEHLAFVAHDLRTPLNAISLAARGLEDGASVEGGMAPRMIGVLRRNVQQLASLVDTVLKENSRIIDAEGERLARRSFDLWPMVEGLIADLQPLADTANTRLVNAVPDDVVVHADAALLRRVLQNLVANAIAHTSGGEVSLSARALDEPGAIECEVSDNGVGIAPERLQKVFEVAETDAGTADAAAGSGLGLGLAIVKSFVEAHGGSVSAESAGEQGTTVRFRLPGRAA